MDPDNTPETGLSDDDVVGAFEKHLGADEAQPPTEGAEAPEEEGESEEQEQAEETQEPEVTRYTVKVNGKDEQVTLEEALKGYSREADYTRNKQQFAQERQAAIAHLQNEQQQLRMAQQHAQQMIQGLQQMLQEPEPDWQALYAEDPIGFPLAKHKWETAQRQKYGRLSQFQQQALQLQQYQEQQEQIQLQQTIQSEQQRLLELLPEWRDEAKMKADRLAIREYAKGQGYSAEDLNGLTDSRAVVILRKAMLYDRIQAKAKTVQTATPTAKAGTPAVPRNVAVKSAKQSLAKSGSVKDAANLFLVQGILDAPKRK